MIQLLEREQQLEHLGVHLREVVAGHGRLVLVGGEAGVGKTTLVEAFCRQAAGTVAVLRISCDALSTPGPLGPVRDLALDAGNKDPVRDHERDQNDQGLCRLGALLEPPCGCPRVVGETGTRTSF